MADIIKYDGKQWFEVFKTYDPSITQEEANYFLWNETCFPFDDETTLKQIQQYYSKKEQP